MESRSGHGLLRQKAALTGIVIRRLRARILLAAVLVFVAGLMGRALEAGAQSGDEDGVVWVTQFGTAEHDTSTGVAFDLSTQSLYTTGYTQGGDAGGQDAWIARHDNDGNEVCTRVFGTSGDDGATGIASDGNGRIYVAGFTPSSSNPRYTNGWIARYDANCEQQWVDTFGLSDQGGGVGPGLTSEGDGIADVAVDEEGNVLLAGWSRFREDETGCSCGTTDILLAKYSSGGDQLLLTRVGMDGEDSARGMAVDSSGNVYVTGRTEAATGSADAFVAKYDSDGNQVWYEPFGTDQPEFGETIAVDGAGNAYAAGWTSADLFGPNAGDRDGWLVKFTSGGNQVWGRQVGSSAWDVAYAVAVDSLGTLYLAGETAGQLGAVALGNYDVWVATYDADGNQAGMAQYGTSMHESMQGMAIDDLDQVYLSGESAGVWGASQDGSGDAVLVALGSTCEIEGEVFTRPEQSLTYYLFGARVTLRRNGNVLSQAKTQRPYGHYTLKGPCTDNLVVRVELEHTNFDTDTASTFQVRYQQQGGPLVYVETAPFSTIGQEEPLRKDIIWVDGYNTPSLVTHPSIQPNRNRFDDLAMIYVHTYEAWQLSSEVMNQTLDFNLPVDVVAYSSNGGIFWNGSNTMNPGANNDPFISISGANSPYPDLNRPMNREWHEFGHHVMADTFANLMPSSPGDVNHGGAANNSFVNPSTTDSWMEGFAEFYAMAVAKYIAGDPEPWIYVIPNLESNYTAWNDEEFAVAGLLWDLIDTADARDITRLGGQSYADCMEISLGTLWTLLETDWGDAVPKSGAAPADYGYIFDVKHLYDVLAVQEVGAEQSRGGPLSDLEELFVAHGFFVDGAARFVYDDGEEIGRAADPARPNRRNRPQVPGSYIRYQAIDGETGAPVEVDFFTYDVRFDPPFDYFSYRVRVPPTEDGYVYYYGPDPQYPATTMVAAYAGGQRSVDPLTFDNEYYWSQMAGGPTDSFVEYQFELHDAPLFLPMILRGSEQLRHMGVGHRSGNGADASSAPVPCAPAEETATPTATPTPTPTQDPGAPAVESISPTSVQHGASVQVTIGGLNFQPGANAFIGTTPLQNMSQPDTETLIGTVPGTLSPGTYDVVVVNPGGLTNILPGAFTVLADSPGTPTPAPTDTATPEATPSPTATETSTPEETPAVLASDSFDRADADRCNLGSLDGAFGGQTFYYLPLWSSGNPADPTGADIVDQALKNNGQDFGGVMLTTGQDACTSTAVRGANVGQDLNIRVDLLLPADDSGHISEGGPFVRGRTAARGDGLGGGSNTGFWIILKSSGEVEVLNLGSYTVEGSSPAVEGFDTDVFHTLEVAIQGTSLQVNLDGVPVPFDQNGGSTTLTLTDIGANSGTAGISFGARDNRGEIGGQRADNLIITEYRDLSMPGRRDSSGPLP